MLNFNRNNCYSFNCFTNPKRELSEKVEINEVGLGQLFDLLEAFFCVYSSPEKLLAPQSQKSRGLSTGGWGMAYCLAVKNSKSLHGRLISLNDLLLNGLNLNNCTSEDAYRCWCH